MMGIKGTATEGEEGVKVWMVGVGPPGFADTAVKKEKHPST